MSDVKYEKPLVDTQTRRKRMKQKGMVVWFTGLSGSGKSAVAKRVEQFLVQHGRAAFLLDGDNMRRGLCSDLGFSDADRDENIRRIAETAALFEQAGVIALVSAITPFERERKAARAKAADFTLVWTKAKLDTCAARDPKGLYAKARAGGIENFTGIGSAYEEPTDADIVLETEELGIAECVDAVIERIRKKQKWNA